VYDVQALDCAMHWLVVVDLVTLQPCNIMSTVTHQPRGIELTTQSTLDEWKDNYDDDDDNDRQDDDDRYVAM